MMGGHSPNFGHFDRNTASIIASIKTGGGSTFTAQAVLFGGSDGRISEDSADFKWDGNKLLIGPQAEAYTSTPTAIGIQQAGTVVVTMRDSTANVEVDQGCSGTIGFIRTSTDSEFWIGSNQVFGIKLGEAGGNGQVGFCGAAPASRQTVTGSRGANDALASLLTGLATLGLITDSSSA